MPQGLQIFNSDGTIALDTSTRTGRLVGSITVQHDAASPINITIPRAAGELCFALGTGYNNVSIGYGLVTYDSGLGYYVLDPSSNLLQIHTYPYSGSNGYAVIHYGVR